MMLLKKNIFASQSLSFLQYASFLHKFVFIQKKFIKILVIGKKYIIMNITELKNSITEHVGVKNKTSR